MRRRFLPSIGELTAFECATRHSNFTHAASEMCLTPGAVSRQIRLLEERLGCRLFERAAQRVVLTDAGKHYLRNVRRVLGDLESVTRQSIDFGLNRTALHLAVLPTLCARWLMPRLPRFLRAHPDVTVNLTSRPQPFDFSDDPFDAAIHFGAPAWTGAHLHKMMDERIFPVAHPSIRRGLGISEPRHLLAATLLHQTTRPDAWTNWLAAQGVDCPAVLAGPRYDQFAMIAEGVAAGVGIGLLPRVLIERELAVGALEILFDRPQSRDGAYYFVVPLARAASPAVVAFRDWILTEAHASSP